LGCHNQIREMYRVIILYSIDNYILWCYTTYIFNGILVIGLKKLLESIGIWGDSLLQGVVLEDRLGRYSILEDNCATAFARNIGVSISNHSRFGCTAPKGLKSLHKALENGATFSAAVLEFGGNDCDFNWAEVAADPCSEHIARTPLDAFAQCYGDMIASLRGKGIEPVLVSLPPLDAERYFDWITRDGLDRAGILAWLGDVQHIYRWHERYSNAVSSLARKFACHFVDVRDAFLSRKDYRRYICADGIHPNREGHALMENAFCEYAEEFAQ
jgi:acyl-CoA thioesterase I